MKKLIKFLPFFLLLLSCSHSPKTEQIGDYNFVIPIWWDEIDIELNISIDTEDEMRKFVTEKYGEDVGTIDTWKEALKAWAIYDKRNNGFPVHIAHCYETGNEYENAIAVYEDLYYLADKQEEKDWYKCYLSYSIGQLYEKLNNNKKAALWYSYATKSTFTTSDDFDIRYYAEESKNKVFELDPDNANKLIINAQ